MTTPAGRSSPRRPAPVDHRSVAGEEGGFALLEVLVASVILLLVAISLTTVLVGSLRADSVAGQRETAAGIASDTIENAKAIGFAALAAAPPAPAPCPEGQPGSRVRSSTTVPVLGAAQIGRPHWIALDHTAFCVGASIAPSRTLAIVTVTVSWASGTFTSVGGVGD
jgi:type II secretory pathway pseudopilin PulG